MWGQILLTLAPMVLEALGNNFISTKRKNNVNRRLGNAISKQFEKFADTSLDCGDFYRTIQSYKFVEMLRNYFFLVNDGIGREEYINNIEAYIVEECPKAQRIEIREFIMELEALYCKSLRKIIQDYPEINMAFQLMSISHREILSQIRDSQNEFKRYFDSLNNRDKPITDDDINFYHSVSERDFGIIRFTGISGAERKRAQDINEFYVKNTFSYYGKDIDKLYDRIPEDIQPIQLENFFDLGNKIVLIGGAGLGKSTTLNYLFCNYEKMYGSYALKLKLDLKEYAKEITESKQSIIWCLANEFSKRIQNGAISSKQIQEIITQKLMAGQCLVILDALDEIPTQNIRNKVRDEIETFTKVYYLNRFIISTREVGYLKNRFDETFLHIRINKFDAEQIKSYSEKWYRFTHDGDPNISFEAFWRGFEEEVARARCENLISNPIILILALVIFDIESSLPTRRVEFYKKCIETFLTERENRKGAFVWTEKAKSILSTSLTIPKIAHYRFKHLNANVGYKFSEEELKQAIIEAIEVSGMVEWEEPVSQYSKYLIERTELIREVDENILDFAHKTFYEYFLSIYFTKTSDYKDLVRLLRKWIGDSNNDELARLIVEVVIQNNEPKQHDAVMSYLFDELKLEGGIERRYRRTWDVFSLLADLYDHNLIQPKYQKEYNKFILFNSNFIFNFERRRIRFKANSSRGRVRYDEQSMANYFWEEVQNDNLIFVVDSLGNLNEEYTKNVISHDSTPLMSHVCKLLRLNRYDIMPTAPKKITNKYYDELVYFLSDGLSYTLTTPQIFLSVLSLSMKTDSQVHLEELLKYQFMPSDKFREYVSPESLVALADRASSSPKYLALLLIAIVECSICGTNSIFEYLFVHYERFSEKSHVLTKSTKEFMISLWEALNNCIDYDSFKANLESLGLYDKYYDLIFEKNFNLYIEHSKGQDGDELKKYMKKLGKYKKEN